MSDRLNESSRRLPLCFSVIAVFCFVMLTVLPGAVWAQDFVLAPHPPLVDAQKVLPDFVPDPADHGQPIRVSLCRNEFESASFVMRSSIPRYTVDVEVSDLQNSDAAISSSAVDVRWVKCWYQSGTDDIINVGRFLTPELLLKNPNYIQVNSNTQTNIYPWVTYPGLFNCPADAQSLQPLGYLFANFTQQVWLTINVPEVALPGLYSGTITVKAGAAVLATIPLEVRVLDFLLQDSMLEHGLYTNSNWGGQINGGNAARVQAEMQNLIDHGIDNVGLRENYTNLTSVLSLMESEGLRTDKVFIVNCSVPEVVPIVSTVEEMNNIDPCVVYDRALTWMQAAQSAGGVDELYLYLADEVGGDVLAAEAPVAAAVHSTGAKTWVAASFNYFPHGGDFIDYVAIAGPLSYAGAALAEQVHSVGSQIYSYANPQCGVEKPETYRRNFGLKLWQENYDGSMNWAWYWGFGESVYDDFDSDHWRDHCMVYPTVSGVIDTIQWEGWREAYDDCRYVATLEHCIQQAQMQGRTEYAEQASAWLAGIKSGGNTALADLDTLRSEIIEWIQPSSCAKAHEFGYDLTSDINNDCYVDMLDFALMSQTWTRCINPQDGNCDTPWQ